MKQTILLILSTLILSTKGFCQKIDTLYYDENWIGVENLFESSFYRVLKLNSEKKLSGEVRDYYRTGELQGTGTAISISKFDDKKSKWRGKLISYFKSGVVNVETNFDNDGIVNGKIIRYYENGSKEYIVNVINGFKDGIEMSFYPNGKLKSEAEFLNGKLIKPYYLKYDENGKEYKIDSNSGEIIDGANKNISNFEFQDKEIKSFYLEGNTVLYYDYGNVKISLKLQIEKNYGKYYVAYIYIENNTQNSIDINPNEIEAIIHKSYVENTNLKVFTHNEYLNKVGNSQFWDAAAYGFSQSMAAYNAGKSTTITNSNTNTDINGTIFQQQNSNLDFSINQNSSTNSTTNTNNGFQQYQAQQNAQQNSIDVDNQMAQQKKVISQGYLKRNTLFPNQSISGFVNIQFQRGETLDIYIPFNGEKYKFVWNVKQ